MTTILSRYQRFLMALFLCLPPAASAEIDWASLVWQNDLFAGIDGGGYTNGLFISLYDLSWEGEDEYKPPLLTQPLLWMLNGDDSRAFSERTLGQAMVTPEDISKAVPDPNDAPYAGLLMYRNSHIVIRDNFADNVSTTIGLVGPSSMAEQVQTFIHKVTGSTRPMGWDYQLKDEPVFMLSRTSIWRHALAGNWLDAITIAHARGGNLESAIGVGGIVRIGQNLDQSFAPAALHFGSSSAPTAINGGWYVYAGFEADYVFNNIFINGNTYRKSQSSDLKNEQLILISGITYAWKNFSIALAFKTGTALDKRKTDRDDYGTVTLAWRM